MFGYGANYFCYDSEVFDATIKAYDTSIKNLRTLKTTTGNSIETLKGTGWNSEAGREFFRNYMDEWSPILDDYIELLEFLRDCVQKGKDEFEDLVTEAETLSIDNSQTI